MKQYSRSLSNIVICTEPPECVKEFDAGSGVWVDRWMDWMDGWKLPMPLQNSYVESGLALFDTRKNNLSITENQAKKENNINKTKSILDSLSSDISHILCIITGYIEDIYSFAVNTINIVIECNENISIFTSAKHE